MARQRIATAVTAAPLSARAAGLRYVCDATRGITRMRRGSAFRYVSRFGRRVTDDATLTRIRRLAIPPAWTSVWIGTLLAAVTLRDEAREPSAQKQKSTLVLAVGRVAAHLGNTPSVCRACYIHPSVLEAYSDGTLQSAFIGVRPVRGLSADEAAVLALLENRRRDWRSQLAEAARAA